MNSPALHKHRVYSFVVVLPVVKRLIIVMVTCTLILHVFVAELAVWIKFLLCFSSSPLA